MVEKVREGQWLDKWVTLVLGYGACFGVCASDNRDCWMGSPKPSDRLCVVLFVEEVQWPVFHYLLCGAKNTRLLI